MMRNLLLLTLALTASIAVDAKTPAGTEQCHAAIRSHILKEEPEAAKKFFQLQAKLTLHRLAWTYLKLLQHDKSAQAKRPGIEGKILGDLAQFRKARRDTKFAAAESHFREAPLSRRSLGEVFDAMKPSAKALANLDPANEDFVPQLEDYKMIGILAETEDSSDSAALFWRKSKDYNPRSVLNLVKIINASYAGRATADVVHDLPLVEKTIETIETDLAKYAKLVTDTLQTSTACAHDQPCPNCAEGIRTFSDTLSLLSDLLNADLKRNHYEGVRYGDVWLRTSKPASHLASPSAAKPVAEKAVSADHAKKVSAEIDSSSNTEHAREKPTEASVPAAAPEIRPAVVQPAVTPKTERVPPHAESAGRSKAAAFELDPKKLPEPHLENPKLDPSALHVQSAAETVKRFAVLLPCLSSGMPEIAKNPLPYLRALAALNAERAQPILATNTWNKFWHFPGFKSRKSGHNLNPVLTDPEKSDVVKSCPGIGAKFEFSRETYIHDLQVLKFMNSNPPELVALPKCSGDDLAVKLLLAGAIHLKTVQADEFKDCKRSDEQTKVLSVMRTVMQGIRQREN